VFHALLNPLAKKWFRENRGIFSVDVDREVIAKKSQACQEFPRDYFCEPRIRRNPDTKKFRSIAFTRRMPIP
jgi:hypothetical protein